MSGVSPAPAARLAALACALALAACTDGGAPPETREAARPDDTAAGGDAPVHTHRWTTRLASGDGVVLVNELGDLRARGSGDAGLHYAGVVQKLGGEARDPDFATERRADGLRIVAGAPEDWIGRIDASARVPPGSPIELRIRDGLIEVRTGDNDVRAVSDSGRISVRTDGRIEARGDSGDMLIVLFGKDFGDEGAGRVESRDGDIELWIQPDGDVAIEAEAGGGLDIDVGEAGAVTRQDATTARVTTGEGRSTLHVTTRSGRLVLRALPAQGD